jgi:hypothetical protein
MPRKWDIEQFGHRLVSAGMPRDHALRTAAEISDHLIDLQHEEQSRGMDAESAHGAACRRLGDPDAVLHQVLRSYRRQSFIGRHPFVFFALFPFIAALVAQTLSLILLAFPVLTSWKDRYIPYLRIWSPTICLLLNLGVPLLLAVLFAALARRRAFGLAWRLLPACIIAPLGACLQIHVRVDPAAPHGAFFLGMLPYSLGSLILSIVPILLAAALVAGILSRIPAVSVAGRFFRHSA